jgi:hypothetical protein
VAPSQLVSKGAIRPSNRDSQQCPASRAAAAHAQESSQACLAILSYNSGCTAAPSQGVAQTGWMMIELSSALWQLT